LSSSIIQFDTISWEIANNHVRQKRIVAGDCVVRLLELASGFQEYEWCCKRHVGYVVDGDLRVDFPGRDETLRCGDGFVLTGGNEGRHKATVLRGPVTLFLVESI
jgi:hypothetical protein